MLGDSEEDRQALQRIDDHIRADSTVPDEQRKLAEQVAAHYGQLDVAFLNAGVSVWQPMEAWTEEMFDRSFDINVKGPFFLMPALLPVFAKPASVILNTSRRIERVEHGADLADCYLTVIGTDEPDR